VIEMTPNLTVVEQIEEEHTSVVEDEENEVSSSDTVDPLEDENHIAEKTSSPENLPEFENEAVDGTTQAPDFFADSQDQPNLFSHSALQSPADQDRPTTLFEV
jgi:hypothetical protein